MRHRSRLRAIVAESADSDCRARRRRASSRVDATARGRRERRGLTKRVVCRASFFLIRAEVFLCDACDAEVHGANEVRRMRCAGAGRARAPRGGGEARERRTDGR